MTKKKPYINDIWLFWLRASVKLPREAQIQALKQKKCSSEVSMMLSRIFTDFERINDHALNVSQELDKITVEIPD